MIYSYPIMRFVGLWSKSNACYRICRYWLVSLMLQSSGSSRREYLDEDPSGNKVLRSYIGHPHLESKIKPTHPPMKLSKVLTKYTYQNTELGNTFSRSLALKTAKYVFFQMWSHQNGCFFEKPFSLVVIWFHLILIWCSWILTACQVI